MSIRRNNVRIESGLKSPIIATTSPFLTSERSLNCCDAISENLS